MNKSYVLRVTVDMNVQEFVIDLDNFGELSSFLGGFPVIVRTKEICKICGPDAVMLVDDEGFRKHLEKNFVGSMMYAPGVILGNIIFCKEICGELQPFNYSEIVKLKYILCEEFECSDEYEEV